MSGELRKPKIEGLGSVETIYPDNFSIEGFREEIHELATQLDFVKVRYQNGDLSPAQMTAFYKVVAYERRGFEIADFFSDQLTEIHERRAYVPAHYSGERVAQIGNHLYEAVYDEDRSRHSLVMHGFKIGTRGEDPEGSSIIFRPTTTRTNQGRTAARLHHFLRFAEDFGIIY